MRLRAGVKANYFLLCRGAQHPLRNCKAVTTWTGGLLIKFHKTYNNKDSSSTSQEKQLGSIDNIIIKKNLHSPRFDPLLKILLGAGIIKDKPVVWTHLSQKHRLFCHLWTRSTIKCNTLRKMLRDRTAWEKMRAINRIWASSPPVKSYLTPDSSTGSSNSPKRI